MAFGIIIIAITLVVTCLLFNLYMHKTRPFMYKKSNEMDMLKDKTLRDKDVIYVIRRKRYFPEQTYPTIDYVGNYWESILDFDYTAILNRHSLYFKKKKYAIKTKQYIVSHMTREQANTRTYHVVPVIYNKFESFYKMDRTYFNKEIIKAIEKKKTWSLYV